MNTEKWLWCTQCHRVYRMGEYRVVRLNWVCPNEGCYADILFDVWTWHKLRELHPEIPERETVYLL